MGKRLLVMTMAVVAFAFGTAVRSNAGTDMIEPYRAPAPAYSYAPPPRPVVFVPPPVIGFAVGPGFGFYGRGYGFYRGHRFYGRHAHWHGQHRHWR